jgi:hypothetical protein
LRAIGSANLTIATEAVALQDVESAWLRQDPARLVFTV